MLFEVKDFKKLASIRNAGSPCVSMYIPTHRAGYGQEDRIRFKNALSEVNKDLQREQLLGENAMIEKEAKGFLTQAYELLDSDDFWLHLSDGLAIFIGKDLFEYYECPIHFSTITYVNDHFFLRPLMPLINKDNRFFLLVLSQGDVRFFEGNTYSITPVKINDLVPANFAEAMAVEDPEKSLQFHNAGKESVHHGHGIHKDQMGWQLAQYCRMIDDGLMKMLHDESAPMILAGVNELVAIYRDVSDYKNIVDRHVSGNLENDDPVLLHEKAWEKIKPTFNEELKQEKKKFEALMAENKASSTLLDIVPAAVQGKVETLFLTNDTPIVWGKYDAAKHKADLTDMPSKNDECLINLAAVRAWEQGGKVYHLDRMDMPFFTSNMNAIYRY